MVASFGTAANGQSIGIVNLQALYPLRCRAVNQRHGVPPVLALAFDPREAFRGGPMPGGFRVLSVQKTRSHH